MIAGDAVNGWSRGAGLLKNINGAKKSAKILPVRQLALTLHKN